MRKIGKISRQAVIAEYLLHFLEICTWSDNAGQKAILLASLKTNIVTGLLKRWWFGIIPEQCEHPFFFISGRRSAACQLCKDIFVFFLGSFDPFFIDFSSPWFTLLFDIDHIVNNVKINAVVNETPVRGLFCIHFFPEIYVGPNTRIDREEVINRPDIGHARGRPGTKQGQNNK